MCRPPSEQSVRAALGSVFSDVTIERIQAIPSPRLQRLYEVTLSDGKTMRLVMSPSTRLRLLRSEHFMIPAEALAVRWIRNRLSKDAETEKQQQPQGGGSLGLAQLVPDLIHLSPGTNELGSVCSFYEPTKGTPLALVPGLLSREERQQVDGQVGRMFRELAHFTSPSGRFGPVANCLSPSSPRGSTGSSFAGGSSSGNPAMAGSTEGVNTWSGAFHLMLEGILRDGEDMAVMISYSAIRRHFKRLRHLLDLVTIPRLVVIDGADESNVLVSSLPSLATATADPVPIPSIAQATSKIQLDTQEPKPETEKDRAAESEETSTTAKKEDKKEGGKEDNGNDNSPMVFAGLRDWSTATFGDPLIATVFSDGTPSSPFLQGFNDNDDSATESTEPSSSTSATPLSLSGAIIEDPETAHIRRLLYQVYHAAVSIIKEFYRPRGGTESSRRELEGRKKLTEALAKLELVQDHEVDVGHLAAKRSYGAARLSGEMSPAKRVKEGAGAGAGAAGKDP
ncbi:hypothetical protein V8F20_008246 [Naviculisporaceae sp. PSN 640]